MNLRVVIDEFADRIFEPKFSRNNACLLLDEVPSVFPPFCLSVLPKLWPGKKVWHVILCRRAGATPPSLGG